MDMYRCTKCGFVYNPASGDHTQNIPPKTPFENLPDDWICPRCGVGKTFFVRVE